MRKIIYEVSISYYKFHFDNVVDAAKFAEEAIQHIEKEDKSISMDLIIDEEESDAETEEA